MGVRLPSVQTNTLLNANVGINTETIVCTTPPINISLAFQTVFIFWWLLHTVGATATSSLYRIRRGTTVAGQQVNLQAGASEIAGNFAARSGMYFDTPGDVAGQQYTLTCIDQASTGVGLISDACLIAICL